MQDELNDPKQKKEMEEFLEECIRFISSFDGKLIYDNETNELEEMPTDAGASTKNEMLPNPEPESESPILDSGIDHNPMVNA